MYIVTAEENQIKTIVDISVRAFETDVNVGGAKGDCPPGYDSVEWHKQMAQFVSSNDRKRYCGSSRHIPG